MSQGLAPKDVQPQTTARRAFSDQVLGTWELGVAVLLTVAALALRFNFAFHAGALWRDETNSVNLASTATLQEMYTNLEFDSFPALWLLVLRYYMLAFGDGDSEIRVLGLGISLLLPLALWWACRQLKVAPIISLIFCGIAPAFVIWAGVANRGYGLGSALLAASVGAAWRVYLHPGWKNWLLLFVLVLAAMHTLYYNALLVAAALGLLVLLCMLHRRARDAALMVIVGAIAAASMLIYVGPMRSAGRWNGTVMGPIDFLWLLQMFKKTIAEGGWLLPYVFCLIVIAAVSWGGSVLFRHRSGSGALKLDSSGAERIFFACSLALTAFVVQMGFLRALSYWTQSWYYVTLILVLSLSVDTILGTIPQSARMRWRRIVLSAGLAIACMPYAWTTVSRRQTNVDVVAHYLAENAASDDLIVIYPWWPSITFNRYYRGNTPWVSLPPLDFYRWHRFDLVQAQFADADSAAPVLQRVRSTLAAGRRVWVIGWFPEPSPQDPVWPPLPSPGSPRVAWGEGAWLRAWGQQGLHAVRSSSAVPKVMTPSPHVPTNELEKVPLIRLQRPDGSQ